jgi:hypothetical protein
MVGEVLVFSFEAVVHVNVVAPEAISDNAASVGVGASALAIRERFLLVARAL